jgi:hypothetical protein
LFDTLKRAFSLALLLCHYDFLKTAVLKTNALDNAIGAILSQYNDEGMLQPCAFFSRKMNPAEINYDINDKELLDIVELLHAWHHYVVFIPADEPLTILLASFLFHASSSVGWKPSHNPTSESSITPDTYIHKW